MELSLSFLPPLITPSHLSEADPQWQLQRSECPIPWPCGAAFRPPGRDSVSVRAQSSTDLWQSSIPSQCATWTDSCSFIQGGISSVILELVRQSSGKSICVFPLLWQLWGVYKNGLLSVNYLVFFVFFKYKNIWSHRIPQYWENSGCFSMPLYG